MFFRKNTSWMRDISDSFKKENISDTITQEKILEFMKRDREMHIKASYERIIDVAKTYSHGSTKEEYLMLLDYLIDTLLDDVCTSVVVEPLTRFVDGTLPEPFPNVYIDEKGNRHCICQKTKTAVDLSTAKIYVRPWNNDRTKKSMKRLSKEDFTYYEDNHWSIFYTDINLCYVYNGNHSINAGRYFHKGTIFSRKYDLPEIYPYCMTDGLNWYNPFTNQVLSNVSDFRLAAVYTLAQMRYTVKNQAEGSCFLYI